MMSFPVGRKFHFWFGANTYKRGGLKSEFLRHKVTLVVLLFLFRHFRQKKKKSPHRVSISAPLFVKKAEGGRQSPLYVLGSPCGGWVRTARNEVWQFPKLMAHPVCLCVCVCVCHSSCFRPPILPPPLLFVPVVQTHSCMERLQYNMWRGVPFLLNCTTV